MTESDKKLLTEWLGECWHDMTSVIPRNRIGHAYCHKCDMTFSGEGMHFAFFNPNSFYRTFTTWQDMGDCMEQLVAEGKWEDFLIFCEKYSPPVSNSNNYTLINLTRKVYADIMRVIFRPTVDGEPHFCKLVAEFIKEGKG